MPFYEYIVAEAEGCDHCRQAFTVLQRLGDEPLERCPECGCPVRRLISAPNVVGNPNEALKPSEVEKAGFTQYRKIGKGVYEKSAGKGPGVISAD
ncbi:MAG: FmdB family zinc ribbon protein [Wenzhouxiangella sp.]